MDKTEILLEALTDFRFNKEPNSEDMLELFYVVNRCLKQGDGLLWSTVREILWKAGYK